LTLGTKGMTGTGGGREFRIGGGAPAEDDEVDEEDTDSDCKEDEGGNELE
jgi:hypothetical protein